MRRMLWIVALAAASLIGFQRPAAAADPIAVDQAFDRADHLAVLRLGGELLQGGWHSRTALCFASSLNKVRSGGTPGAAAECRAAVNRIAFSPFREVLSLLLAGKEPEALTAAWKYMLSERAGWVFAYLLPNLSTEPAPLRECLRRLDAQPHALDPLAPLMARVVLQATFGMVRENWGPLRSLLTQAPPEPAYYGVIQLFLAFKGGGPQREALAEAASLIEGVRRRTPAEQYPVEAAWEGYVAGLIHAERSDAEACFQSLDLAIPLYRRLGLPGKLSGCLTLRGRLRSDTGNLALALADLEEAAPLVQKMGQLVNSGILYNEMGNIYTGQDRLDRATAAFRQSIVCFENAGLKHLSASPLKNIGVVYRLQGRLDQALDCFLRAGQVIAAAPVKSPEDLLRQADIRETLAIHFAEIGRVAEADVLLREALQTYTQLWKTNAFALDERMARLYLDLAYVAQAQGKLGETQKLLGQAEPLTRRSANVLLQIENQLALGQLALEQGQATEALARYSQAAELAKANAVDAMQWEAEAGRGQAQLKLGDFEGALAALRRADRLFSDRGETLEAREWLEDRSERGAPLYDSLLGALATTAGQRPAEGRELAAEAFHATEKSRAAGLRRILQAARVPLDIPTNSLAGRRLETLAREIATIQRGLGALPPEGRAAQRKALDRLENEIRDINVAWQVEHGSLASREELFTANVADVRRVLPPRTALLEYHVGDAGGWVFYLSAREFRWEPLRGVSRLKEKVGFFCRDLEERGAVGADHPLRRELGENLLAVLRQIDTRDIDTLVIIPHGFLHRLPFETLGPGPGYRFFGERYQVTYHVSATAFYLQRRREASPEGRGVLLATAAHVSGQRALPWAAEEVRQAWEILEEQGLPGRVLTDVRESELKRTDLTRFSVLHFACHGEVDLGNPARSALILNADSADDGVFQFREIMAQPNRARLVVLAACRSGVGRIDRTLGCRSLGLTFLYAGADGVLETGWDVPDPAAARFAREFYALLARGLTPVEALARVKRAWMASPDRSDPYLWAPYVLLGDAFHPVFPQGATTSPRPLATALLAVGAALFLALAGTTVYVLKRAGTVPPSVSTDARESALP